VKSLKSVDAIVLNSEKDRLTEAASELMAGWKRDVEAHPVAATQPAGRSRAFVKIQDGCNQFCAFCVIPGTRGREANRSLESVLAEVRDRVGEGFKEVVITGPQIGSYGQYPPTPEFRRNPEGYDRRLHGLIKRILAETDLPRLRVSSIQPQDLTPRLLDAFADPRVCSHVHLALQSGSDAVLGRMGRRYSTEEYRNAVHRFREAVPDIAITTDIMVGFPGETRKEFEDSYRFCREIAFAAIHVFPYSPRPGTRAYDFDGNVPDEEKRQRMRRMLDLAEESGQRFRRSFVDRHMDVLWEEKVELDGKSYWSGLTDNYIRAYSSDPGLSANQITRSAVAGELSKGLLVERPCYSKVS
jgi:threonylcarbamoyladenosine tRNA methylthiotransferase MtaB